MKKIIQLTVLLGILIITSSNAQSDISLEPNWEAFKNKIIHFSNLSNIEYEEYKTEEKDSWKRAFHFNNDLGLGESAQFLYGYDNAKQEYIECIISGFNGKPGKENLDLVQERFLKIKEVMEGILNNRYKKFEQSSIRKECLYCSDNTMALWKDISQSGNKYLETKYISLAYDQKIGLINIQFHNNKRIIDDFFNEKEKVEKPESKFVINLKKEEFSNATSPLTEAGELVDDFLKLMKTEKSNSEKLKSKMLPAFLISRQLASREYFVNIFGNYGNYKIVEQNDDQVVVYLWAKNLFWTHKITFKVKSENGKLYIKPSEANKDNYVIPWDSIERYVKVEFVE